MEKVPYFPTNKRKIGHQCWDTSLSTLESLESDYRFLSYGDSSFILN